MPSASARVCVPVYALLALVLAGCAPDGTEDAEDVANPASYADILMAAPWASDMVLEVDGDVLVVADDGLPDRGLLEAYAVPDGTIASAIEVPYAYPIPLNPVLAAEPTPNTLGAIGVTLSGGLLFNPYDADANAAIDGQFVRDGLPFIDACNGHPGGRNFDYHYHGVPYCITDEIDTDGAHSALLGALLDGFPLYGAHGVGGEAPTDLDACNGHTSATPEFPAGIYHYHLTETTPYSILCYSGEIDLAAGGGGPDDGGGGGPVGGGDVGGPQVEECAQPGDTGCCGDDVCDGPETADNCPDDCA